MQERAVRAEQLTAFARDLSRAHGASDEHATMLAEGLVWCDLVGRDAQGVWRLPKICERIKRGLIEAAPRPRITRVASASAVLDGDRGSGYYVGRLAMDNAIEMAGEAGAAVVVVRNSNHFGAGAYYVERAAARGMIGIAMSNSTPKVAAYGGNRAVLGTNPLAFGAPRRDGRSILLDLSTSAMSGSEIRRHVEDGLSLPPGTAVDDSGEPTLDPRGVDDGSAALLPFGGPKGFGLSLMVETLCGVVAGAGISGGVGSMYRDMERAADNGHFFLAVDIERLLPRPEYLRRMDLLAAAVGCAVADGSSPGVRFPGEARWETFARRSREGIPLLPRCRQALVEAAEPHGLPVPWSDAGDGR